ncbi:glycosyl transferase family 90 [Halospina denitrificans]|uniref:Glycosyl transferase family 90 n=1 Tax=Halospina denitrificans TaxID=332522 RepID=A0A4V3ERB6_9GAMM|nr:glycosyl transferase family 90 [Halospina denitrificans]TDT44338.1 glycosyl transferase family 90 [Halospina denitrificans]
MISGGRYERNLHKLRFYTRALADLLVPDWVWRRKRARLMAGFRQLDEASKAAIEQRVTYYNRLSQPFDPGDEAIRKRDFSRRGQRSAYYLDFKRLIRCFPDDVRFSYRFGDLTTVPDTPSFVKSRPIGSAAENANSVLLKLNQVRHYFMVSDGQAFRDKHPKAIWRGKASQPQRREFVKRYHGHPLCDVGCNHPESEGEPWHTGFMPASEQLAYRYIISIEGNDVATNLKWILASNSLCLMRKPRYETWFMEGTLEPGIHYAQLADDHSDLEETIRYYNDNPDEAETIIRNANRHVAQFMDPERELLISLLVMERYFRLSTPQTKGIEGVSY